MNHDSMFYFTLPEGSATSSVISIPSLLFSQLFLLSYLSSMCQRLIFLEGKFASILLFRNDYNQPINFTPSKTQDLCGQNRFFGPKQQPQTSRVTFRVLEQGMEFPNCPIHSYSHPLFPSQKMRELCKCWKQIEQLIVHSCLEMS